MSYSLNSLTNQINQIKFQLRVVKHQICATKRLISWGLKQFIVQLLKLESELESLEGSLFRANRSYSIALEKQSKAEKWSASAKTIETPMERRARRAAEARWSEQNYIYDLGDEHLEPLANTAGNTCKEVCDNVYLTGSYRQKEIAFGIQFAIQTGRASGEIVEYLTADKTREVINLAIADFNNIQVRGNVSHWLVKHFYN
jgi:hypothetical protein